MEAGGFAGTVADPDCVARMLTHRDSFLVMLY